MSLVKHSCHGAASTIAIFWTTTLVCQFSTGSPGWQHIPSSTPFHLISPLSSLIHQRCTLLFLAAEVKFIFWEAWRNAAVISQCWLNMCWIVSPEGSLVEQLHTVAQFWINRGEQCVGNTAVQHQSTGSRTLIHFTITWLIPAGSIWQLETWGDDNGFQQVDTTEKKKRKPRFLFFLMACR